MAYKGLYTPKNPKKYRGDVTNIVWRSTWERQVFEFCDLQPSVLQWSSEEHVIPYQCPVRGTRHRYFPDIWMRYRHASGEVREALVEIKPDSQTRPPPKPKRITRRYKEAVMTYLINERKWEMAREYCKERGMEFQILTEHGLGIAKK